MKTTFALVIFAVAAMFGMSPSHLAGQARSSQGTITGTIVNSGPDSRYGVQIAASQDGEAIQSPEVTGVRLHFQLISAGPNGSGSDPAIARVESVLRDVFRFAHYSLEGEAIISVSGNAGIQQRFAGPEYRAIAGRLGHISVRSNGVLTAPLSIELTTEQNGSVLETTVNLTDGQTIVLGTAGGQDRDSAIILTVTPAFQP